LIVQFSLGACDTLSPLVASIIVAGGGLKGVALFDSTASIIAVVALAFGADLVVPTEAPRNVVDDDELIDVERDGAIGDEGDEQQQQQHQQMLQSDRELVGGDGENVSMGEFLRWLVRQRLLLVLMGVFMWCNGVYAQVQVLLPVLLKENYSLVTVGTVLSGSSLGVLLGAFVLGASPQLTAMCTYKPLASVLFFVAMQGVLMLGLLFRPSALLCAIGGCLWHACEPPIAAAAAVIVNGATPNHLQGRFSSAKLFLVTLGMPLANMVLSPLVDYLGTMPLIAFLGTSLIVLAVAVLLMGDSNGGRRGRHHGGVGGGNKATE
jgi:hypothetical protein